MLEVAAVLCLPCVMSMVEDQTTENDIAEAAGAALKALVKARVVGVLRAPSAARALALAEPAIDVGLRAVEVTFTVPDAADVIAELARNHQQVLIGAGTLVTAQQAEAAAAAGAAFLVGPHFDAEVLAVARRHALPYVPGALTPSEIFAATSATGGMVKVFPVARMGGGKYVADLLGPYPDLQLMVTGGVSLTSAGEYFDAGAKVVGIGSLFDMAPDELGDALVGL